jgi:Flp pilus assembly pilin Flp
MNKPRAVWDRCELVVEYYLTRIGRTVRDDSGAVSTEAAVLTALLVAVAVAVGGILLTKATSNAEAIPNNAGTTAP